MSPLLAALATGLAVAVSAMPQAPALSTGSDCSILATGVLYQWGYNAPTDTKDSCCTNSLSQSGKVTCAADGQTITAMSFPNAGLAGQVPGALSLLKSLTSLDISNNPGVTLGLQTLAGLPALTNLNIAGCGFTGPAIPFPSTLTCNLGTSLCGNPGCKLVNPLPACPASATGNNDPASFVAPTASTATWILLGAFGGALILLGLMCFCCNQRGAVAKRLAAQGQGYGSEKPASAPVPATFVTTGNEEVDSTSNEMAMITLSRNGIPKRTFSLPETRKLQSKEEATMDVSARDPFIAANHGQESFPVRRFYAKEMGDELSLTDGDSVVLTKVFRDGWAEGVSMRAGGPALFPLACLGGGVPIVLAERLRVARMMARGGPSE